MLGLKWKIGTGLGLLASIGLAVALVAAKIENRVKQHTIDGQAAAIVRLTSDLATSRANFDGLKAATDRAAAQQATRLADTERRLAAVRAAAPKPQILTAPPKGDTLEARVRDVDARFLETLK